MMNGGRIEGRKEKEERRESQGKQKNVHSMHEE